MKGCAAWVNRGNTVIYLIQLIIALTWNACMKWRVGMAVCWLIWDLRRRRSTKLRKFPEFRRIWPTKLRNYYSKLYEILN